jgi:tripartite-type tricarboxylate transporter receptor subunit TctC
VGRVLKLPDVADRLLAIGIEPAYSTPEELDKFTAEQVASSAALAKKAGIKPE